MTTPKYRVVFFDVDSTLVTIEGIDVLAGGNAEIVRLTEAAMNGEIPLDQVYGKRLEIIRPSQDEIAALGQTYVESLVPGAIETVNELKTEGVKIHLVTAGVAQAIMPLARELDLPETVVHAVSLRFDSKRGYAGFDTNSPLTRPGGKEIVVRDVRARTHGKAAFVGDGVTDLEARPAVDLFVGFGGVHIRPRVRDNADVFVEEKNLKAILPHLL